MRPRERRNLLKRYYEDCSESTRELIDLLVVPSDDAGQSTEALDELHPGQVVGDERS